MSMLIGGVVGIFRQGWFWRWSGFRLGVVAVYLGGDFLGDWIYTLSPGFLGAGASMWPG